MPNRNIKMKASLMPLDGKYYGTKIFLDYGNGDNSVFVLWDSGNYQPSIRQLEYMGYTKAQWDANEMVPDGWGEDTMTPIRQLDIVCDSHFESNLTYNRALKIIDALNRPPHPQSEGPKN